MVTTMSVLSVSVTVLLVLGAPTKPQAVDPAADKAAVYQAALDYVEGVYEVNPAKIEKSVHPNLTKYGFMRRPTGEYAPGQMTYQQLLGVAASWNKDGKRDLSIKKVEVQEYPEFGMEAIWRIEVVDFPAFIVIDDKGNDFFKEWNLG